jgi:hypothetical protein
MGRSWVARTMARLDCYAERSTVNNWMNTEPGETRAWYFCTQATFGWSVPSYVKNEGALDSVTIATLERT